MKRASSTVTIYQKDLCRQAHRMDRLMRFLPVPTGGKPSKWSVFSGVFSLHYPLEGFAGFERKILKISSFTTHWREMGRLAKKFWNFFLLSIPLTKLAGLNERISTFLSLSTHWTEIAIWPKSSESFSLQYSLDKNRRLV